jgi:Domain of unknown function (DUF397)
MSGQTSKNYRVLESDGNLPWRKAVACANTDCVEVAEIDGLIAVRDSMNTDRPALLYTADEWQAFLDGAKRGEFDKLV